jgi:hypothetical protein
MLPRGDPIQEDGSAYPKVFVDGDPEKVAQIQADLLDAMFTSRARPGSVLKRARPIVQSGGAGLQ